MGVTPGRRPARFPGYDVIDQRGHWDPVTQGVVLARLGPVAPLRFFTAQEEPGFRAVCDLLIGQDADPRVPVAEAVDSRLADGRGDGYRYASMPEDGEAWRRSLAALDSDATEVAGVRFHELDEDRQKDVMEAVRCTHGEWHGLPAARLFSLWMRYVCAAFYAHPWAWNEIGFGGPAYPRGYKNGGLDKREPWEVPERDASDPIPWANRVEEARKAHLGAGHVTRPGSAGPHPW